jgi:P-type E1-E2 ATPase
VAPGTPAAAAAAGNGSSSTAEYVEVATSSVRPGDILRVLPGERIPCDGKVVSGTAALDEALLTGESALVTKSAGEDWVGGL